MLSECFTICLAQIWVHFQYTDIQVYIRYADLSVHPNTSPLVISGNQGQQWLRAYYTIRDQRPFQFVIEGQVGNGPQSDIVIDDIDEEYSGGCFGAGVHNRSDSGIFVLQTI